jgi:LuxR family maltose regulon positive regulatory protein
MAGAGFEAVGSKLRVPERRRGLVARPELIGALEAGRAHRLTVVSAPTGFGKTSAVSAWAQDSPARFAWVALDERDDDPTRFWGHVVAAIEAAAPELPQTAGRRLRGPGVSIADEVLPALVNELAHVAEPLVLVLDDLHVIESAEIHAGLEYVLERPGPDVHVVLATQAAPPLRLGALRAAGEVAELGLEQLRFDAEETAALLNGTHGLGLDPLALADLQRRTEGWVAGLNLIALSLRESTDRADLMARMPVDDRRLVGYLWDEVAARQPAGTREFLIRTAVLERLSGPLCDAVAQCRDSAELLEALERDNLFVVPLDGEGEWFRYHTLFRTMLLRRLAPDQAADLHRRASAWFAEHGEMRGAIEHALRAGDVHVAADTLRRNWLALYSAGHATDAIGWIDRLPEPTLADYPELALARAGMARAMGRSGEVEPWLRRAEDAALAKTDERERRELAAGVARQRAMLRLSQADVGEAVRLARIAVELRPGDSPDVAADHYFLAICLFWTDATGEAEALLRGYLEGTPPGEQDVRRVFAMALLAAVHAGRGELDAAERLASESLATSEARGLGEHPPTELAFVADGIVALARSDSERAEARLEHAAMLARRGGDRVEIAHALLWLGRARARSGDGTGAADALEAARGLLGGARVPALVTVAALLRDEIGAQPAAEAGEDGDALSAAELRVLELLPSDLTYREIAAELYLSLNTVRTHGQRIRRKLGASTRDEAVSAARRLQLI